MHHYRIYRLCRDTNTIDSLKKEETILRQPKGSYVTGIDMYTFINNVIQNCDKDYALLIHDDVILPLTIEKHIQECITSANNYMGEENWGIIGNAGIEVLTKKVLHYLTDPDIKIIPPYTKYPSIVESVDGNTMLLNIKNLRAKKIHLPKKLTGFHLYDLILCLEAAKNRLLCAVSSHLFVSHLSGGNRKAFIDSWNMDVFQEYFSKTFSNKIISSLNGDIVVSITNKEKTINVENEIKSNIMRVFGKKKYELHIITEKPSSMIENFKKNHTDNISVYIHNSQDIRKSLEKIVNDNSFIVLLDENDSLHTDSLEYLPYLMSTSDFIIGDTKMISEDDFSIEEASNIEDVYTGKRDKPLNIMIYKTSLLKDSISFSTAESSRIREFEIFFETIKKHSYTCYPILLGERHYKKSDYNIHSHVFTSILSEITNRNSMNKNFYDFYRNTTEKLMRVINDMNPGYQAYISIRKKRFWRLLSTIKNWLSLLKRKFFKSDS